MVRNKTVRGKNMGEGLWVAKSHINNSNNIKQFVDSPSGDGGGSRLSTLNESQSKVSSRPGQNRTETPLLMAAE
jgi:hypothetical protein